MVFLSNERRTKKKKNKQKKNKKKTRTCLHDVFLIMIRSEQCKNKCATLSCEPNNKLNIIVCTISVTEGKVADLKLV